MIAKYILLALTNLLAFAGAWLFAFTETDKDTGRKTLTKWGKVALPAALVLLVAGFGLTIWDDLNRAEKAEVAAATATKREEKLQGTIETLTAQIQRSAENTDAIRALVTAMAQPASAKRDAEIAALIKTPELRELADVNPDFKAALTSLERSLGGRTAMLERMQARGAQLPNDERNVLTAASLDLNLFGRKTSGGSEKTLEQTRQAVLSLLRGLDADIVAVQEVADLPAFQSVLNELPHYFAVYGSGDTRIIQAVLVRRDRFHMRRPPIFLDRPGADGKRIFARSPIVIGLNRGDLSFTLIAFDLKSQWGADRGVSRRRAEIAILDKWIAQRGENHPVLLIGRTQVGLDAPELKPLLDRGVRFGSAELPAGSSTYISDRLPPLVLSHIGGYGPMTGRLIAKSTEIHRLETLLPSLNQADIKARVTNHNPLVTAFNME